MTNLTDTVIRDNSTLLDRNARLRGELRQARRRARTYLTLALAIALVAVILGLMLPERTNPHWECAAEDEVVVIDNTCRHIDTLVNP